MGINEERGRFFGFMYPLRGGFNLCISAMMDEERGAMKENLIQHRSKMFWFFACRSIRGYRFIAIRIDWKLRSSAEPSYGNDEVSKYR